MKIAVACDHAGLELKEKVKALLADMGHEVIDFGTHSKESVDYPDFGLEAVRAVVAGRADRAVNICWTGNGMMIASNKVRGIRAGIALSRDQAYFTRLHNDANVLVLAQKYTPEQELPQILAVFLGTDFEGGRHVRRLKKIAEAEGS